MRTNEARARLIHRRTAEIKQERRIKRQRRLDAACMAVCLLLVIGIGTLICALGLGPFITFFDRLISRKLCGLPT